jgi:hypothetical protein
MTVRGVKKTTEVAALQDQLLQRWEEFVSTLPKLKARAGRSYKVSSLFVASAFHHSPFFPLSLPPSCLRSATRR